jgi:predicted amidohydrolase YtcJ
MNANGNGRLVADRILYNANVVTVDGGFRIASAVAIRGDQILHVGSDHDVRALCGPGTREQDLHGLTVLPGMIDNHVHLVTGGLESTGAKQSLTGTSSIAEIVERVAAAVRDRRPGEWIVTSFVPRTALSEGRFPTRADLDPISPNNPVYLKQAGKNVICNSYALRLAGIDRNTPDPGEDPDDAEGHIVRDADGEPTGHLIAGGADIARRRWWQHEGHGPKLWEFVHADIDEYAHAIRTEMKRFNEAGITGIRDMGVSPEEIDAYVSVAAAGEATVRSDLLLGLPAGYMTRSEIRDSLDSYFGPTRRIGGDWVSIGGMKIVIQTDGWWLMQPEKARQLIVDASVRGFTLAFHAATGPHQDGTELMLDALEEADRQRPIAGRRFTLEHGFGTLDPTMWERAQRLGMILATQPLLAYYAAGRSSGMKEAMAAVRMSKAPSTVADPRERAVLDWGFPIRSWMNHGLLVTCGTDAPAARYDPDHPLLNMYIMCTQDSVAGVLLRDETIGRADAIRAMTINNAYAIFEEATRGSVEAGKLADLVVLSADPVSVSDDELADIRVLETIVGGKTVHERAS